jgi:steroid delta-isomerase-like uncharacterized protein
MAAEPKAVVRRFWEEIWNHRNPPAAEELMAEDFVFHTPTLGTHAGRAQTLAVFAEIRTAFPDMSLEILEMIAEGGTVVTYWRTTATHCAPYCGVAPTGQQVTWSGLALHRVVDGRIVEHRAFPDTRAPGGPHEIASRKPRAD